MLYFVRCLIFLSRDFSIRCQSLCNMPSTLFDVISSYFQLLRHICIFCVSIFPLKIAFVICIKVYFTLNFKIMSAPTFVYILISDISSPQKWYAWPLLRLFLSTTSFRASGRRACFDKTEYFPWLSKEIQWKFYSMMSLLIRFYDVSVKKKW